MNQNLKETYEDDLEHAKKRDETGFWGAAGAGCIIVAKSTGRVLLPFRSRYVLEPNTWGVWGGAIDGGFSPEDAVRNEVKEECGYVGPMQLIPLYVFQKGTFKYFNFLSLIEDEFTPRLDWETESYGWFTLDKLPSPLHFGLKALLNDKTSLEKIKQYMNINNNLEESSTATAAFGSDGFPLQGGAMNLSKNQNMYNPPISKRMKNVLKKLNDTIVIPNAEKHSWGGKPLQKEAMENPDYFIDKLNEFYEDNMVDDGNNQRDYEKPSHSSNDIDMDDIIRFRVGAGGKAAWDKLSDVEKREAIQSYKDTQNLSEHHIDPKDTEKVMDFIIKNQEYLNTGAVSQEKLRKLAPEKILDLYDEIEKNQGHNKIADENKIDEILDMTVLKEDKTHPALKLLKKIKTEAEKNNKTYFKKEVSNPGTTSLVNGKEFNFYEPQKDSLKKKDIPMLDQTNINSEYLEKTHRGLEDYVPETSSDEFYKNLEKFASKEIVDVVKKRQEYIEKHQLRNKPPARIVNAQIAKVKESDKIKINEVKATYKYNNRLEFVIFDKDSIILLENTNDNIVPLVIAGVSKTLSENFNELYTHKFYIDVETKQVYKKESKFLVEEKDLNYFLKITNTNNLIK